MASAQTNKQAIFPNRSRIISKATDVSAFSTFQSQIDQVHEQFRVEEATGELFERMTGVLQTNNGSSNSPMFIVLCVMDPDEGRWTAYRTKKIPQVTVAYDGSVLPASFCFEFNGGMWLREGTRIGFAQSAKNSADDNWHITTESCTFNKNIEG